MLSIFVNIDLLRNRLLLLCCWILLIIGSVTTTSCSNDEDIEPKPYSGDDKTERVVIMYVVAENNLSSAIQNDIDEVLSVCKSIPKNDKFILYLDDIDLPRIYEITNKTNATDFQSLVPIEIFQEELDSASPTTLDMILSKVMNKYPCKSYGLVLWSHGSGWIPENSELLTKSFGLDNNKNSSDISIGTKMKIIDMAHVLSKYQNIEYLMFDACFMQSIEVAYELRNTTKYIIGSSAELPASGAPYDKILGYMFDKDFNPQLLAYNFNDYYARIKKGVLVSVIETKQLDEFADVMESLLSKHIEESWNFTNTLNYYNYNKWGKYFPDMYDMRGLMQVILADDEYEYWCKELDKILVASYCYDYWYSSYPKMNVLVDEDQYSGVSMFMPLNKYVNTTFNTDYLSFSWAKSIWKSFYTN